MRRVLAIFVTVSVLVASGSAAGAQEDSAASFLDTIIENADETLGEDATIAVVRGLDRGYDLLQIIEGLLDATLAADGAITDEEGTALPPANAPAGVVDEDASAASGGPAGGKSRAAGGDSLSAERIGIALLERGIDKVSKRLDKKHDLGDRAEDRDSSLDVFTMLAVLVLVDAGYSTEQIILDGLIEGGIDLSDDLSGATTIVIKKPDGSRLRPDGEPPTFEDESTGAAVGNLVGDMLDAISGEDPLSALDNRYKRQYTLTIDAGFSDEEGSTGTIKGKVNFGELLEKDRDLVGRGAGQLLVDNKVGCSLSEGNTTKYPYKIQVPIRFGLFARGKPGSEVRVRFEFEATSEAKVTAEGDSICLDVVRETADVYGEFITLPDLTIRLRDGATATADTTSDGGLPIDVTLTVKVKEF